MAGTVHGILAGYDGSSGAKEGLDWAAQEAQARGATLTVCHAWSPGYAVKTSDAAAFDLARRIGERILEQGLLYAREVMGPSEVRPLLVAGTAAQEL
ncbi:MAG: universal stress protein [Streptosporangiales bacterium]